MTRSRRALIACFAGVVALTLVTGSIAGAQTPTTTPTTTAATIPVTTPATTPGLLTTAELPAGYTQPGEARTFLAFSLPVTSPASCTETPVSVTGITSARLVTFVPPGGSATTTGLSEAVLVFPDAKAAKAAYAARVKNDKARWKCASVGFVPVSQSTPIATFLYEKATVPKVGSASFATSGTTMAGATAAPVTVTFVSGPYLVLVGFAAPPNAPSSSDMKAILKAAQRRLTQ
jgi:hypothetical protein